MCEQEELKKRNTYHTHVLGPSGPRTCTLQKSGDVYTGPSGPSCLKEQVLVRQDQHLCVHTHRKSDSTYITGPSGPVIYVHVYVYEYGPSGPYSYT